MYNTAKVGKFQLVKWITYITIDGTDENDWHCALVVCKELSLRNEEKKVTNKGID